jgi:hypothetical protein
MKSITCIVEAGRVDSNGFQVDLLGLDIGRRGEEIPVTLEFGKQIGTAELTIVPEGLQAKISVPEEMIVSGFPAIGGIAYNEHTTVENGVRRMGKTLLLQVSICGNPNADPLIKAIEF